MTDAAQFFAGVEWPTVALLAGIVLWEELRLVPPGAVVFRALLFRPFEPVEAPPGRRVVGLWPPITTAFIVFPRTPAGPVGYTLPLKERYALVRRQFLLFRLLGGLGLLVIVLGVPVAAAWLGGAGLIGALALTLVNSVLIAFLAYRAAARAGVGAQMRRVPFLSLLSPFAAPRAMEVLLELIFREETVLSVAAVVLTPEAFREWVRPRAYDVQQGVVADAELDAVLPAQEQRALINAVPVGAVAGEGYCPRCGATYQVPSGTCSACEVGLVGVGLP